MKKGFTLVELLAVIIILAVIALIATPIVLNVVESSRKSAFESSIYGIIEAIKLETADKMIKEESLISKYTFPTEELEFQGEQPTGVAKTDRKGKISIAVHNGKWCGIKAYDEGIVTIKDYLEGDCKVDFLQAPTISLNEDTLHITSDDNRIESYAIYMNGNLKTAISASETIDFDLTTLNLEAGSYQIIVKSVANGYDISDASNAVTYESGIVLPVLGTTAENMTWEQIKAISDAGKADEYFNLGDTKTITLTNGNTVVMEIVAFDEDTKEDGTKAAITWLSKDIVTTHVMNNSGINLGSWEASDMRVWLRGDFYNSIPAEVKNAIVPVDKTYFDYNSYSTRSCLDAIWIPSYREIFGGTDFESSGADYTAYFNNNTARIKTHNGTAVFWWLRSASNISTTGGLSVSSGGGENIHGIGVSLGVVFGFCTGSVSDNEVDTNEPNAWLYNGVSLPDINTVWTDKETYPYLIMRQASNGTYYAYLFGGINSDYCYTKTNWQNNYVLMIDGNGFPYQYYTLLNGVWAFNSSGQTYDPSAVGLFYSNFDIYSDASHTSIYLSASNPIPVYE